MAERERRSVVGATAKRYENPSRGSGAGSWTSLREVTHPGPKYAAWILTNGHRRRVLTIGGVRTAYMFGLRKGRPKGKNPPKRPQSYGAETQRLLKQLWVLARGWSLRLGHNTIVT